MLCRGGRAAVVLLADKWTSDKQTRDLHEKVTSVNVFSHCLLVTRLLVSIKSLPCYGHILQLYECRQVVVV